MVRKETLRRDTFARDIWQKSLLLHYFVTEGIGQANDLLMATESSFGKPSPGRRQIFFGLWIGVTKGQARVIYLG